MVGVEPGLGAGRSVDARDGLVDGGAGYVARGERARRAVIFGDLVGAVREIEGACDAGAGFARAAAERVVLIRRIHRRTGARAGLACRHQPVLGVIAVVEAAVEGEVAVAVV